MSETASQRPSRSAPRGKGAARLLRGALVPLALAVAVLSGARADQPAAGAAARDYTWVPLVAPSDTTVPDPPDGRWLVDENGLEYTLFRWPRHEGYYRFDDEQRKTVTLRYGMQLTVEYHDERYLYLRWYRTAPIRERLDAARAATAADIEAIRAGYRTAIPERDALRLEPWDEGLPRAGQWRNGFAVADMNGDGHLDLVHGPPRKGPFAEPIIFLGDGAGHWRRWREARFPPLPYGYGDVAVGDLDGDGQMDVVLAAHLTGLFALRGDGAGGFTPWSGGLPVRSRPVGRSPPPARGRPGAPPVAADAPPAGPPAFTSRALALADWNGDGRLDILALAEGPTSVRAVVDGAAPTLGKVIFLNRGDGSWQAVHGPGSLMGDSILPVDLDGDGRLDFVTDSRVAGSADLLNYGEPGGTWRVAALPGARARLRVYAVAVADFDRDGRRDLAVTFQSQEGGEIRRGLDVYFGAAGEPGWRRVSIWAGEGTATDAVTALAAGDLDGDGDPDLVGLTARGETWLFVNDGGGDFALDRSPEADPGREHHYCAGYAAKLVDLDGDGRAELVTAFAGEPGSEAMLRGILPARCRAEGVLRAWKVVSGPASAGRDRAP